MSDDYRARLIAAQQALGLSNREMAKRLMTPRQTYEQWISGARPRKRRRIGRKRKGDTA